MKTTFAAVLVLTWSRSLLSYPYALQPSNNSFASSATRRSWLSFLGTVAASAVLPPSAQAAVEVVAAASQEEDVYFGVGCFWHIQHEFAVAEREILGRDKTTLTCKAGYAGGKNADREGRVCYHNLQNLADYGRMGHGEVVGMTLPKDKIVEFSEVYFSLFNPKTKDRVDPMDRGAEYRSLLGLPGGTAHPAYPGVEAAAERAGMRLAKGNGNDPDTLGKQMVWVYDSNVFPFYQAEVYHQFHNDFQSPPYSPEYRKIADLALDDGRLKITGCPDRV